MSYTHDLVVIGAGSGGLATAFRAAGHGARVAIAEPGALGGTCVNVGCVPKKAMWFAAQMAEAQELARDYGFDVEPGRLDWLAFVGRRQRYIEGIHASYRRRLDAAGIEVIAAPARIEAAESVRAGDRRLRAPHIVVATGARSRTLDLPGFDLGIDSDGFFDLQACPPRVAVVGAGYIGTELAGVLHALGARVDVFARSDVLREFDRELGGALREMMQEQGIGVHRRCNVRGIRRGEDGLHLDCDDAAPGRVFDQVLWAVGRVPVTAGMGLEEAGVERDADGYIVTDAFQDTSAAGIHALGDVASRQALTPVAIAAGRRLGDRLFGGQPQARLDYTNIPSVVFSHPPLASVGLAEQAARERAGDNVRCYRSRFTPMQLALSDRPQKMLMKLVCEGEEERVVGIHALGPGAEEMIQGFAVALKMGARKADLDATVAVHPSAAEELVTMS